MGGRVDGQMELMNVCNYVCMGGQRDKWMDKCMDDDQWMNERINLQMNE